MITVKFRNSGTNYVLKITGHSKTAPKGRDLICAGVSTLVVALSEMLINNADSLSSEADIDIKDGYAFISSTAKENEQQKINAYFEMAMTGINWLSKLKDESIEII